MIGRVPAYLFALSKSILPVTLLSVALAQSSPAPSPAPLPKVSVAAPAVSASASGAAFVYFFDLTGDYERIALATGEEVAHGQIPAAAGVVEPLQQSGFDGCIFCEARYDRNLGLLYAVIAKEARISDEGTKHFAIVALALPQMTTSASKSSGVAEPVVLLTPDGRRLLASYQLNSTDDKAKKMSFALSIYRAPTLKLLRTIHQTTTPAAYLAGAGVKAKLSEQAYFGPDGKTIYDQLSRSELVGYKITKGEIDPSELLAKSGDRLLEPFRDPQTKAYSFAVSYADSAAGKALVAINAGKNAPQGVLTVDLDTRSLSPVIRVAQVTVSTAHLTPDGRQILIEEFELRHPAGAKPDEPQQAIFKTGKLLIFNAATGEKVREIVASDVSGFDSRLLCISPDGGLAFFAHTSHLFGVNLVAGTVSQVHTSPGFVFDRWTECVLADR
jgi:hypothetical protein